MPELVGLILKATGSWHLPRRLDDDPLLVARYTARIHEHLKQLRAKVSVRGMGTPGVRLTPPVLAELLVDHEVITHRHLRLLGDPEWLSRQEERWWTS